jgi:hypothetical protein
MNRFPKAVLVLFILLAIIIGGNAQHHSNDKPSTHGMVIFGTERIYASHLPMFHTPHDYQVIMEIQMDPQAKKKFIRDQETHRDNVTYTIAPETFILPEMLNSPHAFKAMIYRGHFERGGTPVSDSVTINIKQIIYQLKFEKGTPKPANYSMIVFGNRTEQFAVHQISSSPDFDQVMRVMYNLNFSNGKSGVITLEEKNNPVGVSGNVIKTNNPKAEIRLLKIIYLEFDDLAD